MRGIFIIILCLETLLSFAQLSTDYIGAGQMQGITVTSSSNSNGTNALNTINGSGMDAERMEASRFLAQATLGFDNDDIDHVLNLGFENWIDDQLTKSPILVQPLVTSITSEIKNAFIFAGNDEDDFFGPWALHFNYAWWTANMQGDALLRQRVALALSEILVISINSDLIDHGAGLGSYYDVISTGAFGNYADLLNEVTRHPCMGLYLSHLNNPKTDLTENIRPDQNYAREIMQLFTVGLYELNMNGTRKLDGNGDPIPTYDNTVIEEMSKVFTGLGAGGLEPWVDWTTQPYFGLEFYGLDKTVPLNMYENQHEPGPKNILGGNVINADGNNTGLEDIAETIDVLVNHQSMAPFIAYRLIQRLVKSNPSPAYVARVATVFANNGAGVAGDLGAVVKAILMDEEARSCSALQDPASGKLREPFLRYTQLAKAMNLDNPLNRYWNNGFDFRNATGQYIMAAPSVFNFYPPDFQPNGPITDANMVAPEFKLHNTRTSIEYINKVNQWVVWDALWFSWEGDLGDVEVAIDYTTLTSLAADTEALINHLDILFTHGQLTDETRAIIKNAVDQQTWSNEWKARMALNLILVSPDYVVLK